MQKLSFNQYFLIIPQIKLFPAIKKNTIVMIEQIMNAVLLSNEDNIQTGINRVINLEMHCKNLVKLDYLQVLNELKPLLEQYNISVVQGEAVRTMYIHYNNYKEYYSDIGKQAAINLDFAKAKKISYTGQQIILENTYIEWLIEILENQRNNSKYNPEDKLVFRLIEPFATLKHVETRNIIKNQTKKYANEYRKFLELQLSSQNEQ